MRGDLPLAYKCILLSEDLEETQEWQRLHFLTLVGLDRPTDAAAFLKEIKNPSEELLSWLKLIMEREGPTRSTPSFKAGDPPVTVPKDIAKKAVSIARGSGSYHILTSSALYSISDSGVIISTISLAEGRELLMDKNGEPLILTSNSLISSSRTVSLPLSISSAASFACAPGGCFYILDSAGRIFMVDDGGKILEERQTQIKKPSRIRTDKLFRVFIFSSEGKDISVYSASFTPLTVLSPEVQAEGASMGRISDFRTDFAGNSIVLDKSRRELFFFNFQKDFLGKSSEKIFCADVFAWEGKNEVTILDAKKAKIMKVSL